MCVYTDIGVLPARKFTQAAEEKRSCCLIAIPAAGEGSSFHSEWVITCELIYSKKMQKMLLKFEKVESWNAVRIKVKHCSISDHFCKHAAQHFVFFFWVNCAWNKIHCFKPQKSLQDERQEERVSHPALVSPFPDWALSSVPGFVQQSHTEAECPSRVYQIIAMACMGTRWPLAQTSPLGKAKLSSGLLQPLVMEGNILPIWASLWRIYITL